MYVCARWVGLALRLTPPAFVVEHTPVDATTKNLILFKRSNAYSEAVAVEIVKRDKKFALNVLGRMC